MSPAIDIDEEVLAELGRRARPFLDTTPNRVIRRLLGLDAAGEADRSDAAESRREPDSPPSTTGSRRKSGRRSASTAPLPKDKDKRTRARKGSLLDERAYELPILQVLDEQRGRAAARDVVERVGQIVDDVLTPMDREPLKTGGVRWEARVQFARLRLKDRGLIELDSPRGTWEISEQGRAWLREQVSRGADR